MRPIRETTGTDILATGAGQAAVLAICVGLGWGVALLGPMSLLVALLAISGVAALRGQRTAIAGILMWYVMLPTQFVPPLRFSAGALTLDPIKVLVCACLVVGIARDSFSRRPVSTPSDGSWSSLDVSAAGLVCVVLLSALLSSSRGEGLQWVAHWLLSGAALALVVRSWVRRHGVESANLVVWTVVGFGFVLACFALFEYFTTWNPAIEYWIGVIGRSERGFSIARSVSGALPYKPNIQPYRSLSLIGHPVFAALAMAPGAAASAGLFAAREGRARLIAGIGGLTISAGVFVTGTRGSMLAVLMGIAGVVLMSGTMASLRRGARTLVAATLVGVLVIGLMISGALPAIGPIARLSPVGLSSSESFEHRMTTGSAALRVALRHPLVGLGPGGFRRAYALEVSASDPIASTDDPARFSVDNMYLLAAADFGLVAVALAGIVLNLLWRRLNEERWPGAGLALRGALLTVVISLLFADGLYVASSSAVLWVLLGVAWAGDRP